MQAGAREMLPIISSQSARGGSLPSLGPSSPLPSFFFCPPACLNPNCSIQVGGVINKLLRFCRHNVGQIFVRDVTGIATMPAIRLVRTDRAINNNLLPIAEKLEFMVGGVRGD